MAAHRDSALHRHLESIRVDDLYVSSFSEKPDLLSQWRGYCPAGSGYCIGIDRAAMAEYCEERELQLEPCLYGHDEQQLKVTEIVTSCMALYPTIPLTSQQFHDLDAKAKAECMVEFNERLSGDLKVIADLALDMIGESLFRGRAAVQA
nr:hypothetical protein pPsy0479b_00063 [Pseudomonas syringae]